MPSKRIVSKNGIFVQRLKDIRPFVDFDFNLNKALTPANKAKIKRYWDEIILLTARPHIKFKTRNKKNLKIAQEFSQQNIRLKDLNTAFIPVSGGKNPKIRFKKGKMFLETTFVETEFLKFNKQKIITDTENHINQTAKKSKGDRYGVGTGKHEMSPTADINFIASEILSLIENYDDPEANNYFGNWLVGLRSYKFKNQASHQEFSNARRDHERDRKEIQRKRRNEKRRRQR